MDPKQTVKINVRSHTSALRDLAVLTPHMSKAEIAEWLEGLARRIETMADEQQIQREEIT